MVQKRGSQHPQTTHPKEDKIMATTIQVRSARDCGELIDGKACVHEISYRVTTNDGHFDSAAQFDLHDIDVNADSFVDDPDLAGLVTIITKHLTEAAGAEGCPNALSTIEKQIRDSTARAAEPVPAEMVDRAPAGIGIPDDDDDEVAA
jgi:hypothetical protein